MSNEKNPLEIKVGLSYEGNGDIEPLKIIVNRLLFDKNVKLKGKLFSRKSNTGIIANVRKHASLFYTTESIEIGFFITDSDTEKFQTRKKKIIKELKKENPSYLDCSVIGVIEPHLEKWLIADKNALRSTLKLGGKKITGGGLSPKDQLDHLYNKMEPPRLTMFQVRDILAKSVKFYELKKECGDFNAFCKDLTVVIKRLN